jgi:hypothetical protein
MFIISPVIHSTQHTCPHTPSDGRRESAAKISMWAPLGSRYLATIITTNHPQPVYWWQATLHSRACVPPACTRRSGMELGSRPPLRKGAFDASVCAILVRTSFGCVFCVCAYVCVCVCVCVCRWFGLNAFFFNDILANACQCTCTRPCTGWIYTRGSVNRRALADPHTGMAKYFSLGSVFESELCTLAAACGADTPPNPACWVWVDS